MTLAFVLAVTVLVADRWAYPLLGWLRDHRRDYWHQPESEDVLLAELTALGLSAGLSFSAALAASADYLSAAAAARVRRALRVSDRAETDETTPLFALADRALVTGAPLLASIDGYATSLRRDRRAAAVERARRLPVKLLFPLALLILPGFLLLTVGPALLAGLGRLGL